MSLSTIQCIVIGSWIGGELDFCDCVIRARALDGSSEIFARAPLSEADKLPLSGQTGLVWFSELDRKWRFK